jgi:hypothetical protein
VRLDAKPAESLGGDETSQVVLGVAGHGLRIAFSFCTDTLPHPRIWHESRLYAGMFDRDVQQRED